MVRHALYGGSIALVITAQAQLAPGTEAPLIEHLVEVNKEWRTMDPHPMGGERTVRFADEADRIATHLHLVAAYGRAHAPEGVPAESMTRRLALLSRLDTYADRGIFPQNHVVPVRNPVFIDPIGTACAVGQLMIESGERQLAEHIQKEMNLAYVHDMRRSDVDQWAVANGFTEDELAWIQPGYPPSIPWYPLGGGTNGTVTELLRLGNGDLIVAGQFTLAGTLPSVHVARWSGGNYAAMGTTIDGEITSAIEFNGAIYLGGSFNGGVYDYLRWNGSAWQPGTAFASKYAYISDLHVHQGVLHAAGSSSGFAGTSYEVKRLNVGSWENVGQQLNGTIRALETFDGALVCGGDFTGNFFELDTSLLHVARLNAGTWEQLGNGLDGNVRNLLLHQDQLYAAGDCVSDIFTRFGLARIAIEALTWEQLMPNITNYFYSPLDAMVGINAMVPDPDGTRIHLGGDFYAGEIMTQGMGLATFHGTVDAVTVLGEFYGPVNDLELIGTTELVAGGASEGIGNIASTDLALGVADATDGASLSVWPNPVDDQLHITGTRPGTNSVIELSDASGRVVQRMGRVPSSEPIDVRDLPAGNYTARITVDNKTMSAVFIKR